VYRRATSKDTQGIPTKRPVSFRATGARKKITGTPTTYATMNDFNQRETKSEGNPILTAVMMKVISEIIMAPMMKENAK
jgi:hypothetical protein